MPATNPTGRKIRVWFSCRGSEHVTHEKQSAELPASVSVSAGSGPPWIPASCLFSMLSIMAKARLSRQYFWPDPFSFGVVAELRSSSDLRSSVGFFVRRIAVGEKGAWCKVHFLGRQEVAKSFVNKLEFAKAVELLMRRSFRRALLVSGLVVKPDIPFR